MAAAKAINRKIVSSRRLSGGHSGDVVERLTLDDGLTAILKVAASSGDSGTTHGCGMAREFEFYTNVPQLSPWRPALLATIRTENWVGIVLADLGEHVRRIPPWSFGDVDLIAGALADMHRETLNILPPPDMIAYTAPNYWRQAVGAGVHSPEWNRWIAQVSGIASEAITTEPGAALRCITHGDVYRNNIFLIGSRVCLVDWALVGWTSRCRDAVWWAIGAENYSGISAVAAYAIYERYAGSQASGERRASLASASGFGIFRLGQERPGTEVRRYLARRVDPAVRWLADDLGLAAPPSKLNA